MYTEFEFYQETENKFNDSFMTSLDSFDPSSEPESYDVPKCADRLSSSAICIRRMEAILSSSIDVVRIRSKQKVRPARDFYILISDYLEVYAKRGVVRLDNLNIEFPNFVERVGCYENRFRISHDNVKKLEVWLLARRFRFKDCAWRTQVGYRFQFSLTGIKGYDSYTFR